jgi:hypothetical protein
VFTVVFVFRGMNKKTKKGNIPVSKSVD